MFSDGFGDAGSIREEVRRVVSSRNSKQATNPSAVLSMRVHHSPRGYSGSVNLSGHDYFYTDDGGSSSNFDRSSHP